MILPLIYSSTLKNSIVVISLLYRCVSKGCRSEEALKKNERFFWNTLSFEQGAASFLSEKKKQSSPCSFETRKHTKSDSFLEELFVQEETSASFALLQNSSKKNLYHNDMILQRWRIISLWYRFFFWGSSKEEANSTWSSFLERFFSFFQRKKRLSSERQPFFGGVFFNKKNHCSLLYSLYL